MKIVSVLIVTFLLFFGCTERREYALKVDDSEIEEYLQVESPSWEDQIIYFIVTDRFMDGDTSNNDLGDGEYVRGNNNYWNGGDIAGIIQKLDYIRTLGATALWITPPVANQSMNPQRTLSGYHGYWASNFMEVDRHLGTLKDYQRLSATLHKNGMYLIQDIVVNHLGDYYTYTGPYNPADVSENFKLHDVSQPTQYPFFHNNAKDPEDMDMGIFHFTPQLTDHSDSIQKLRYQFGDLDDLNTTNPFVREVLRKSYNFWIDSVGVDGYRFDTPILVELNFWRDFLHNSDSDVPGIVNFAAVKGKKRFFNFGETLIPSQAYEDKAIRKIATYLGSPEDPIMMSVLNFPLQNAIQRVFQQKMPTDVMTYRLKSIHEYFPDPALMVNFIDNHDGARYLVGSSKASFRQALLFILTIPGVPAIYYGTEQELLGARQAMFKGGTGSPDRHFFDTESKSYLFLQELIRLRKKYKIFSRGELSVLHDNSSGPGAFVYQLKSGDSTVIVAMNTSESFTLADGIRIPGEAGQVMKAIYSLSGSEEELQLNESGQLNLLLPPGEGLILIPVSVESEDVQLPGSITIDPVKEDPVTGQYLTLSGSWSGDGELSIMVDGDFSKRSPVALIENDRWSHSIPLYNLNEGLHRISALLIGKNNESSIISDCIDVDLVLPVIHTVRIEDPEGDDTGPEGNYEYPTSASYNKQMDIRYAEVICKGYNIELTLAMAEITRKWIPPNGFDHLLLNIFIDVPEIEGIQDLPLLNAKMPDGASWDYMISASGFGNSIYSSDGASAQKLGKASGPAPMIQSDTVANTITFSIQSAAIGDPEYIEGTKIYISTWGGVPGEPRSFSTLPEEWSFYGGTENDPKIMDDTDLIIIGAANTKN